MNAGKAEYRASQQKKNGVLRDELTGIPETDLPFKLEVDHVQAAATATYNSRYITSPEGIKALKEFFNSEVNFQMLGKSANASKGDVRVFSNGKKTLSETKFLEEKSKLIEKYKAKYKDRGFSLDEAKAQAKAEVEKEFAAYTDITYKATAEELADAVCDRWIHSGEKAKENLTKQGVLSEDGASVLPQVRHLLVKHLRKSMNCESLVNKKYGYENIAKDAGTKTVYSMPKIIAGQVIYYVLPPLIFETQNILRVKQGITVNQFLAELKKSGKRVVNYVSRKLKDILGNIAENTLHKFVKNFFDIIIATVKETVKRLMRVVKQLVLSLVNCVKILTDSKSTPAEKADAVTKTLSVSITTVVLEILFEYLEKQFNLPDILMEPLQVIVTILATNLIMLILQEADLFDVKYGLLTANIDQIFEEEHGNYVCQSDWLLNEGAEDMAQQMESIKGQIVQIKESIGEIDLYNDDVSVELEKLNKIYDMGIDFQQEWTDFCSGAVISTGVV